MSSETCFIIDSRTEGVFFVNRRRPDRFRLFNREEIAALKQAVVRFQDGDSPVRIGRHFLTSSEYMGEWFVGLWSVAYNQAPAYTQGLNIPRRQFDEFFVPQLLDVE